MKNKISVVILNWNGMRDTIPCLESLDHADVIVVDNGSTDDSVKAIKEKFPRVVVIETGINLGYAGGNNVGIEYALKSGADLVLLLNNDTVVDPKLLQAFDQYADEHPEMGIIGARPPRPRAPCVACARRW